jgi:hypothetical protein
VSAAEERMPGETSASVWPGGWGPLRVWLTLSLALLLAQGSSGPLVRPAVSQELRHRAFLPLVQGGVGEETPGQGSEPTPTTVLPPTATPCSGTPVRFQLGGVNYPVSSPDPAIGEMGLEWIKFYSGPDHRFPYRVLRRVDINYRFVGLVPELARGLGNEAYEKAEYIDAWEIGNEVNLGASFGWDAPPDAGQYTEMLCAVYASIKDADPEAVVVSAGLAPTGRVAAEWEGHQGYCAPGLDGCIGYYQDDHEFLREMLDSGAGECFDALGYHPYGFGAPYDAAPGSEECGGGGFCFRGVETIRRIMVEEYGVDKPIWATEFGWMVDPREEVIGRPECWEDESIVQFHWQVVSPVEQALNIRGALEYAEENYTWMGPMFLFNYGFYDGTSCDHMGFFDIKGLPAEELLRALAGGCPVPEW